MNRSGFVRSLLIMLAVATALITSCVFGATTTNTMTAAVKVASVFSLSIDQTNIDLGSVKPGDWKEVPSTAGYSNAVVCKSNTGNTWYLKIKASGPLSLGSNTIPLENFKWMSTYAGSKNSPYLSLSEGLNHSATSGYVSFTMLDETVYTSGLASALNDNNSLPNGSEVQFKYGINLPSNPAPLAGTYSTTVVYTLTE